MAAPDLLVIAERIVRDRGPAALTMDALAAASGSSRATVYRKVGSREALLARLAERGVDVGDRSDVRTRILAAAGPVFTRMGFDGATVEAIAEAAGTGVASVYRHFGDKQSLITAFVGQHSPRRMLWRIAADPSGDLRADLERVVTTALEHFAAFGEVLRLALLERLRGSGLLDELARAPDRGIHGIAALLRTYQKRGEISAEDPQRMAQALQGLIFSFGILGPLVGVSGPIEPLPTARLIVRIFLEGVRTRSNGGVHDRRIRRRTSR